LLLLPQVVRIMHELSASGYPRTDLILLRGINGPPLGIPHCELAVRKPRRELSMAQSGLVFDPFSEEFLANQHEIYRRLREEAPAYYNEDLDFYALTRHADVVAAFRDYETYSSAGGIDLTMMNSDETPPKAILFMDPPEHGRMRSLVNRAFTPRAVESLRESVDEVVDRYLGAVDPHRFDVVQDFSALFPVDVIGDLMGVPEEFRPRMRMWMDQVNRITPGEMARGEASTEALADAVTFYYNLVQERRARPREDMISQLIASEIERENGEISKLDDLEITSFALVLVGAGAETVTNLVSNAVAVFAEHPDQWQKLLDDRSKVPAAVEELLRFDGPVRYNLRRTRRQVKVRGIAIPPGKPVLLCGPSANRDSDAFPDADTFDIDRKQTKAVHLGFGYGIHSCLGAALARMETVIALERLLDLMPRYAVIWRLAKRALAPTVSGWSHLSVEIKR
jgi:cytochrome P450